MTHAAPIARDRLSPFAFLAVYSAFFATVAAAVVHEAKLPRKGLTPSAAERNAHAPIAVTYQPAPASALPSAALFARASAKEPASHLPQVPSGNSFMGLANLVAPGDAQRRAAPNAQAFRPSLETHLRFGYLEPLERCRGALPWIRFVLDFERDGTLGSVRFHSETPKPTRRCVRRVLRRLRWRERPEAYREVVVWQ